MALIDEQLSEQFHRWEQRGRGWQVFPAPVFPEPPFVPFDGHYQPPAPAVDDGRKPTFLNSLVQKMSRKLSAEMEAPPIAPEHEEEPEPSPLVRDSLVELQASLPDKLDIAKDAFAQFLSNLSLCHEPVIFELIGRHEKVSAQFVVGKQDSPLLRRQLQAYFPEAVFVPQNSTLEEAWNETSGNDLLAVEFGLKDEFMLPLASGRLDPFIGIVGALSEIQPGELGLFQVLFQPAQAPWANEIEDSVMGYDRKPFFVNAPELAKAAENKISSPLYAVVVRIFVCTNGADRLLQLSRDLAGSMRVFAHPSGNELIPLHNDGYPFAEHIEDVLKRQTRRTGMLLNSDELTGFVHIPSSAVRSPAFQRQTTKTKAAPAIARQSGLLLGENDHAGETTAVRLSAEQRTRHCHIIGASGTGKSTLLFNLIREDIENGEGIAVLDPHGDLIDRICGIIPPERIGDVVLVDPADESHSVGFNILSAHSSLEKNLLASDLVAVFQRLSTSWGDQMYSVLQNAILAFLESSRRGTIADLRRFLIEPAFRNDFLKSVTDPEVVYYWQKSFSHLPSSQKSIGSILTRLDTFLAQKPIRYMVSQSDNKLDFAHIMDTGKILLAKLPEGLLGRENSYLLGTLLVSKFQQIAMSRQAQNIAARRNYWLYIDEFANFITPSMAEILSGARKYRLGLTLAHHELHQLQKIPEVASAVMSHPFTRIVFRVGDDDARKLADGFSYFEAKDLRNLEIGQAVCRVERSDYDFNLTVPLPDVPDETNMNDCRQEVITVSRKKYGTPRAEVEALLAKSRTSLVSDELPAPSPAPVSSQTAAPQAAEVAPPSPPHIPLTSPEPPPTTVPTLHSGPFETKREPSRDLGRGGAQHKAIQTRLRSEGQKLGFLVEVERQLAEGSNEAADLVLKRDDIAIAVEITVTTTISHEFENVQKCLAAGFRRIAVVSTSPKRLEDIAAAVQGGLGSEATAKVSYYSPDDFIAELQNIATELKAKPEPLSPPSESKVRGFKVRRHLPKLSEEEQKQKEDIANRIMAETLRRK